MRFSCKKIFSIQNLLGYPVDLCFALYSILYLLCTIYIYGLQSGSCHATCAIIAIEYVHYYYYVGQQQRFDANKEDYYAKSRPLRILALKIPRCACCCTYFPLHTNFCYSTLTSIRLFHFCCFEVCSSFKTLLYLRDSNCSRA